MFKKGSKVKILSKSIGRELQNIKETIGYVREYNSYVDSGRLHYVVVYNEDEINLKMGGDFYLPCDLLLYEKKDNINIGFDDLIEIIGE